MTIPSFEMIDWLALLQVMFKPLLVVVAKCKLPRTSSRFVTVKDWRSVEQVFLSVAVATKARAEVARRYSERMMQRTEIPSCKHKGQ